jgi:hypothetical protein
MSREFYAGKKFSDATQNVIDIANNIIDEYQEDGFDLTLRQLYYQFVARGLLDNNEKSYKRLGTIISDGRMAGEVDWDAIKDRTRFVREQPSWDSPHDIVVACARQFHLNRWENNQVTQPEVWIEKDALIGVIEPVCKELDVPCFSCRGYVSQSAMYEAAMRIKDRGDDFGMDTVILHLGDHDPSGIDMTRDVRDRLDTFLYGDGPEVKRIALTMQQVRALNPPPNPAKLTDARAGYNKKTGEIKPGSYIDRFGYESWELDAIEPRQLVQLIRDNIEPFIDRTRWEATEQQERDDRADIMKLAAGLRST